MDLDIKRKERKALNSSLYSLTHRNARTIKLVSLRVRRIRAAVFLCRKGLQGAVYPEKYAVCLVCGKYGQSGCKILTSKEQRVLRKNKKNEKRGIFL